MEFGLSSRANRVSRVRVKQGDLSIKLRQQFTNPTSPTRCVLTPMFRRHSLRHGLCCRESFGLSWVLTTAILLS
jgi:hypothetical protein